MYGVSKISSEQNIMLTTFPGAQYSAHSLAEHLDVFAKAGIVVDMICQSAPFLKSYTGDPALVQAALDACAALGVKAIAGRIATGDTFVGDGATKAVIAEKVHPDCVEMEGAAVSQIAARNGVPCVVLRAMSDNADESGHELLVVKKFSIAEYATTATAIVARMLESL